MIEEFRPAIEWLESQPLENPRGRTLINSPYDASNEMPREVLVDESAGTRDTRRPMFQLYYDHHAGRGNSWSTLDVEEADEYREKRGVEWSCPVCYAAEIRDSLIILEGEDA